MTPLRHRQRSGAAQRHVLADLGDGVGDRFGDRNAAGLGGINDGDIGADRQRHVGDHLHEALEQIVAGDEIGFRVELDHDAFGAGYLDADQAFGGDAAGLLGGLGQALLAQPVLRRGHLAIGFGERGLAIHHAGAGRLA